MAARTATAEWKGDLPTGTGHLKLGSGVWEGDYDWRSRSGDGALTNPEELLGVAHAGCFNMQFAAMLTAAGHTPTSINTKATVTLAKAGEGFAITTIQLDTTATVPGIENEQFQSVANDAKANCPVSKALAGTDIHLTASLA